MPRESSRSRRSSPAPVEGLPVGVQVNCALFPRGRGLPWYVPWRDLSEAVEQWREQNRFQRFFFMRKLPGLRLRFLGPSLDERLVPLLVQWLDEAERSHAVRGYRFAVYEPEEARFGGPLGMDIAHDAFDRNSRLAMRYETLAELEHAELSRWAFSLLVTNDLCGRGVEDRAELWDVWHRLNRALGETAAIETTGANDDWSRAVDGLLALDAFHRQASPTVAGLLNDAWRDNEHVIARLRAAHAASRLSIGTRAWLASVCIFHWNRLAIEPAELRAMTAHMLRVLTPQEHRP